MHDGRERGGVMMGPEAANLGARGTMEIGIEQCDVETQSAAVIPADENAPKLDT